MKQDFNNNSTDKQRLTTQGAIKGVMQQIAALAPHPDRPGDNGPVFVKSQGKSLVSEERDAMLGSLFMECMLGCAFGDAFDSVNAIQNTVEMADEVWMDRRHMNDNNDTSYTLGDRNAISGLFNRRMKPAAPTNRAMEAFLSDRPERLKLEATYATLAHKMQAFA